MGAPEPRCQARARSVPALAGRAYGTRRRRDIPSCAQSRSNSRADRGAGSVRDRPAFHPACSVRGSDRSRVTRPLGCAPGSQPSGRGRRAWRADRSQVCLPAPSWRRIENALEAMRLERADDELLEYADAARLDAGSRQLRSDERLDVLEVREIFVHLGSRERVVHQFVLALVAAVTPFGVSIADPRHIEIVFGGEFGTPFAAFGVARFDDAASGVARAWLIVDARPAVRHVLRRLLADPADHGCRVPWRPVAVRIVVVEHETIREIERRPQPIELRRARRRCALRIAQPDRTYAPGTIARGEKSGWLDLDAFAGDLDPAFVSAVLGQARIVHDRARALAIGEARFLDRRRAGLEREVGLDAMRIFADAHAQHSQGLDDVDGDGADL